MKSIFLFAFNVSSTVLRDDKQTTCKETKDHIVSKNSVQNSQFASGSFLSSGHTNNTTFAYILTQAQTQESWLCNKCLTSCYRVKDKFDICSVPVNQHQDHFGKQISTFSQVDNTEVSKYSSSGRRQRFHLDLRKCFTSMHVNFGLSNTIINYECMYYM